MSVKMYQEGLQVDKAINFYKDGSIQIIIHYENGAPKGPPALFDQEGNLIKAA